MEGHLFFRMKVVNTDVGANGSERSSLSSILTVIGTALLTAVVGGLVVVQASLNVNLAKTMGHAIRASCISFWVGFGTLFSLLFCSYIPFVRYKTNSHNGTANYQLLSDLRCQFPRIRHFHCAGVCGAFYVTMAAVCVPVIGFSVFFVCLVCGQLTCALVLDYSGMLGTKMIHITPGRYIGCSLTVIGTISILIVSRASGNDNPAVMIALIFCSYLSGVALPVQAALNNQLKSFTGYNTVEAGCISFGVGASTLSVLVAFSFLVIPAVYDGSNNHWWHWAGGFIGVLYVYSGIRFPPLIGYSTFFVALVCGQLVTSILSDTYGFLGPRKDSARSPFSIFGVLSAGAGAALVAFSSATKEREQHNQLRKVQCQEDV